MNARRLHYKELIQSIHSLDNDGRKTQDIIDDCCEKLSGILFDYQVEACRRTAERMLKTTEPLLIQMATGAGKSWVIVGLSYIIMRLVFATTGTNKKVMMVCPSAELVLQNVEKLVEVGFSPSIFCETLGVKEVTGDIIVGTPVSIKNALDLMSFDVSAFYLDECQHLTPITKTIVNTLKANNPNIREVGLSATPHRTGTGYIYSFCHRLQETLPPDLAKEPYYAEKTFEIKADALIKMGRLVPPVFEKVGYSYKTEELVLETQGGWTAKSKASVFIDGKHDLNKTIVKDIIARTKKRRSVIIFAQNIAHAEMITSYFGGLAEVTHSKVKKHIKTEIIANFKAGKLKYLVNVDSLTEGFDSPITDVVVFLRATESASLFEQMLGRGLRITNDKRKKKHDCLILDYAKNMERHAPDGDPFNPIIKVSGMDEIEKGMPLVDVICPTCDHVNSFRAAKPIKNAEMNEYGYLICEQTGEGVMARSGVLAPVAGHYGNRCMNDILDETNNRLNRCTQTWSKNVCYRCEQLNNNSASYCAYCEAPLSEKSQELAELMLGRENIKPQSTLSEKYVTVEHYQWLHRVSRKGSNTLLLAVSVKESPYLASRYNEKQGITFECVTPKTHRISIWLNPNAQNAEAIEDWERFCGFFFGRTLSLDEVDQATQVRDLRYMLYGFQRNNSFIRIIYYLDGSE